MEITKENRVISVEALNERPPRGILVVSPTYNERENIAAFIDAVGRTGADLLIVDDGSPDGTADLVRTKAAAAPMRLRLMRRTSKLGLGTAYVDAYRWIMTSPSDYRVIVQMDADFSHDPAMVPALAAQAEKTGVAVGSRYVPGGRCPDWPIRRRLLSYFANQYARAVLKLRFGRFGVHDATAGFIAWRSDVLKKIFLKEIKSNGYAFQIETKLLAVLEGFRPAEVPIVFRDRTRGVSKISRSIILEAMILPWTAGKRPSD